MITENEYRLYKHLMRLVSVLRLIEMSHERGHTAYALEGHLKSVRHYLMEHCPRLLLFVELCYDNMPIPDGLNQIAENEAVFGPIIQR